MPKGLMNPKNAVESSGGGFKEGFVRIESSVFKVHQAPVRDGQAQRAPVVALVWGVTRLDEEQEPITNEDGEPVTEELVFGLGGKSLVQVHPGKADSADDEEVEDAGDEVNTEGPTIYLTNSDFKLNKKSGVAQLMLSLQNAGLKPEYLDRTWAPDYIGCVFYMHTLVSDDKMKDEKGQDRAITYKTVKQIVRGPGAGKKPAAKSESKAASNGKGGEEESVLAGILQKLSEDLDGSTMTKKALSTKVSAALQQGKVAPALLMPVLKLVKSNDWLAANAEKFDFSINAEEGTVTFGTPSE